MPFDGSEPSFSQLEKFDRAAALIATPSQWTKNTERNRQGQYCLKGALNAVGVLHVFEPAVLQAINEVTGKNFPRIESFNDHPQTGHADIVAVLDRTRSYIAAGSFAAPPAASRKLGWGGGRQAIAGWTAGAWRKLLC